ncbi:MAG: lysylphosphatidylglycerol synthase transmembrane domain-containing protein [Leptolinea sp.]
MTQPKSSIWKSVSRWLLGAIISLVALFLVFRLANWQDIQSAFTKINPWIVGVAAGMTVLFCISRAIAWRILLDRKATVSQTFFGINAGYLLNNLFPLRAGEIGRAVILGQSTELGTFHVLSTIIIERAFDLAFAALLLLSSLPLALGLDWAKPVAVITLVLVIFGLSILFLIARNTAAVHAWVSRVLGRFSLVKRYFLPYLDNMLEGLGALTNPQMFLGAVFWIAVSWLIGVLNYYIVIWSIIPQAPLWWGVLIDSVLAMGIAIPSAPAALGVFEASMVAALSLLGVDASIGLAYAVVMHIMQFVVTGILGMIGLMKEGRSLGSVFKAAQSQKELITFPSDEG